MGNSVLRNDFATTGKLKECDFVAHSNGGRVFRRVDARVRLEEGTYLDIEARKIPVLPALYTLKINSTKGKPLMVSDAEPKREFDPQSGQLKEFEGTPVFSLDGTLLEMAATLTGRFKDSALVALRAVSEMIDDKARLVGNI
jgi:hypothetical protein